MKIDTDDKIVSEHSNWQFDEGVAQNFDEHVRKSVPSYVYVQHLAEQFSDWFTYPNSTVIDLGSATGETLRRIKHRHTKPLNLIGYDNAPAMIKVAKSKGVETTLVDLNYSMDLPEFSYCVALYTLQFLLPKARYELLRKLYRKLADNGAIFVVEKTMGSTPQTQDILQSLYWEMKEANGFSAEQIINKSKALRGCMYPKTIADNESEFNATGFKSEIVFKETLFCGWLLTKKY